MCRSMFLITNVRVHNPELAPDLTDYRALFGAGGELGQSLHDCRLLFGEPFSYGSPKFLTSIPFAPDSEIRQLWRQQQPGFRWVIAGC